MGSFFSNQQIQQIISRLLKLSPADAALTIEAMEINTCDKDVIREALQLTSMRIASRKIAISTFFIDFIFDIFLGLALVVLAVLGWPMVLCLVLLGACIITQSFRALNSFAWLFGILSIVAFIMQLINFGFLYWYTPVFFIGFIFFAVISPRLQRHFMNKIMSKVHGDYDYIKQVCGL